MNLKNVKSFEDYLINEEFDFDENDIVFESDENDREIYFDGELYEAMAPKLTAKERKKAQEVSQLMSALNKNAAYKAAKEKFIKIFKKEAKATVKELNLPIKVLAKLDKITIRDI